ncbi:MAG: 4Fe-4S binding protein [Coriobacteriia bacterium]|nr:4Fe-4S binding protein [Coriobacteriia bacterium]
MRHKYLKDVVSLSYNDSKCIGCGRCVEVCPHSVFEIVDKKARIADRDSCIECGGCAMNCRTNAIEVSAGVGCAAAVIFGWLTGKEFSCDSDSGCC